MKKTCRKFVSMIASAVMTAALVPLGTAAFAAEMGEVPSSVTLRESFGEYNADNAAYGETNKVFSSQSEPVSVAQTDDFLWQTSTTYWEGSDNPHFAFIDPDEESLAVAAVGNWHAAVNLVPLNPEYGSMKSVRFTTKTGGQRSGIHLAIGNDEYVFLEFGVGGSGDNGVGAYAPYLLVGSGNGQRAVDSKGMPGWVGDNALVDWTINITGTGIEWTAVSEGAEAWAGSYTYEAFDVKYPEVPLRQRLQDAKFPVAALSTSYKNETADKPVDYAYLMELEIDFSKNDLPEFYDYFDPSGYDGTVPDKDNPVTGSADAPVIVSNSARNYQWISSGVFYQGGNIPGQIYIDSANQRMALYVRNAAHTVANLVLTQKFDVPMEKITFTTTADQRVGIRLAVGNDEKDYLEIGTGRGADGNTVGTVNVKAFTPYVLEGKGGVRTVQQTPNEAWTGVHEGSIYDWVITIEENAEGKNVVHCSVSARETENIWTYDYVDINDFLNSYEYPLAFYATGDGYGYINRVEVYCAAPQPMTAFTDNFTYSDKTVSFDGTAQPVAEKDGFIWQTSAVTGKAVSGDQTLWAQAELQNASNRLAILSRYQVPATVNLVPPEGQERSVKAFRFTTIADQRVGLRLAVGNGEQNYLELGTGRSADGSTAGTTALKAFTPYVLEGKDGARTVQQTPNEPWTSVSAGSIYDWVITVSMNEKEQKVMRCTVTARDTDNSWSYDYIDINGFLDDYDYPVAAYAIGDGYGYIKTVAIEYGQPEEPEPEGIYVDNGNGTITVTVDPANYTQGSGVTVLVVYFDIDGRMLTVDEKYMTEKSNMIVKKSPVIGSKGKIFIWQGQLMELSPVSEPVEIE